MDCDSNSSINKIINLNDLPKDCLLHIFRYLFFISSSTTMIDYLTISKSFTQLFQVSLLPELFHSLLNSFFGKQLPNYQKKPKTWKNFFKIFCLFIKIQRNYTRSFEVRR